MVKLKDHISDNHRRASKMLACTLHADSVETWSEAAVVWRARLTDTERAALAFSVLTSLNSDHREWVCEAVFDGPEMPAVPLISAMDEAANWADWADYPSIKACTLAGFNRLTLGDQVAFAEHITRSAA